MGRRHRDESSRVEKGRPVNSRCFSGRAWIRRIVKHELKSSPAQPWPRTVQDVAIRGAHRLTDSTARRRMPSLHPSKPNEICRSTCISPRLLSPMRSSATVAAQTMPLLPLHGALSTSLNYVCVATVLQHVQHSFE